MTLTTLATKNILRNKWRTSLTILGVAVSVLAFMTLQTVQTAWTAAADYAAKDRIGTRHKVTFIMSLPKNYIDTVRGVSGVKAATFANWFGAKHPTQDKEFFASLAVDSPSFFDVYDDFAVEPEQLKAWQQDRQGAIVGDVLARKFGWKVGDKITLQGTIYAGDWQFNILGIYRATRRSVDRSTFIFHWNYLNDSAAVGPERDMIGWIIGRIDDPRRSAAISKTIDKIFDSRDIQTLTMSERDMNISFMGMFSAVLQALDVISMVILGIMALILGNTIAMGVRERTYEYGVLRAIGFLPRHIASAIFGESMTIGLLGGGLGLLLSYPIIDQGIGKLLEENAGAYFPYFRISSTTVVMTVLLSLLLGLVASLIPALQAARLTVTDSLRRVG